MVQPIIPDCHILTAFKAKNLCNAVFNADRHIADIDDSGVGTKPSACFRYNGGGVRVIEHPAVRRVLLHIVNILNNASDGTHTIGNTARATGFLAYDAVF